MTGEIEMLILLYREEDNERQTGSQSCQVRGKIKKVISPYFAAVTKPSELPA